MRLSCCFNMVDCHRALCAFNELAQDGVPAAITILRILIRFAGRRPFALTMD